ncbi:conjugal transfer protein TraF [Rickettsia koreansis]|uniref:conjugal transfer protein TraF n=1 Tax=Rickettsia koreansis TaxID=2358204 RepID=UPI00397B9D9C
MIFEQIMFCQIASADPKPQGFLWYNEQLESKSNKSQFSKSKLSLKSIEPYDQRIEALKQEFSKAQRKALDNPTLENVIVAQRLQKLIMDKAQKFATIWQLATLLDYKLTDIDEPTNSLHKKLYEEKLEHRNQLKLKQLAKNWGLILQIDNICSYCKVFVPIARQFADKYRFQLLLVSNDGENFADVRTTKDTGLLSNLNPAKLVPVLYLVDSSGIQIYPVARGIISEDKIAENILLVVQHHNGLKVNDYDQ